MQKLLLSFVVAFAFHSFGTYSTVYICKGPGSKKYHYNSNCRGLKNCSTQIYEVSKAEAQNMGRGLCGYE